MNHMRVKLQLLMFSRAVRLAPNLPELSPGGSYGRSMCRMFTVLRSRQTLMSHRLRKQRHVSHCLKLGLPFRVLSEAAGTPFDSTRPTSTGRETVGSVCRKWEVILNKNCIPEALDSVQYIVAHVLGKKTFHGIADSVELCEKDVILVNKMCQQRLCRKPVQYILGEWDFHDIELTMRPPVFIPRPETEQLVELAAEMLDNRGQQEGCVLELCCGSGAIILSLLHKFPLLHGVAVDISADACSLTEYNAERLGLLHRLTVFHGDLASEAVQETLRELAVFDMVVSNPPYIPSCELSQLEPQILLHEDHRALDGGSDGLNVVRHILHLCPQLSKSNSDILLEIQPGQPELIRQLVSSEDHYGIHFVSSYKDFQERERFCHLSVEPGQPTN